MIEWLSRRRALRKAREALPSRSSSFQRDRTRARVTCELAERLADPVEPLRSGEGTPLLVDLYRQAIYWGLCALVSPALRGSLPAVVCAAAIDAHGSWLAPDPALRDALHTLLSNDFSFVTIADLGETAQRALATNARILAKDVLAVLEGPERQVARLAFQRAVRVGTTLVLLLTLAIAAQRWIAWTALRPNLAAGKPWRTSSTWVKCEPAIHKCGGTSTAIFFHTNEDASPWIEYDLKTPTRFSRVYVRNRTDAVPDRAIPLVVEISNDRSRWKALASRREPFTTWTAKFKPVVARYVRLRVDRRSLLHLEQVIVLP